VTNPIMTAHTTHEVEEAQKTRREARTPAKNSTVENNEDRITNILSCYMTRGGDDGPVPDHAWRELYVRKRYGRLVRVCLPSICAS